MNDPFWGLSGKGVDGDRKAEGGGGGDGGRRRPDVGVVAEVGGAGAGACDAVLAAAGRGREAAALVHRHAAWKKGEIEVVWLFGKVTCG